jgi:hypothetical protein
MSLNIAAIIAPTNLSRPTVIFRLVWLVHSLISLIILIWGCAMTGPSLFYKYGDGDALGLCLMSLFTFIPTVGLTLLIWLKFQPAWETWMLPLSFFLTAIFFGLICVFCATFGTERAALELIGKIGVREMIASQDDPEYLTRLEALLLDMFGDSELRHREWFLNHTDKVGDAFLGTFILWFLMQVGSAVLLLIGDSALPGEGGGQDVEDAKPPPE